MKIRFVTTNAGKLAEARQRLGVAGVEVEGVHVENLPELQADGLETVARHKAEAARDQVDAPFVVEDAGLFVDALSGFPGVYSAYAHKTLGCDGILRLLLGRPDRTARFVAVAALIEGPGPVRLFRGESPGRIALQSQGDQGFGFDPIFQPDGDTRTFSQMTTVEKGRHSHRGKAFDALAHALTAPRNR